MTNEDTDRQIVNKATLEIIKGLDKKDFLFTVEPRGRIYDCYKFTFKGRLGTIAIRIANERVECGFFKKGTHTSEEVTAAIQENWQ